MRWSRTHPQDQARVRAWRRSRFCVRHPRPGLRSMWRGLFRSRRRTSTGRGRKWSLRPRAPQPAIEGQALRGCVLSRSSTCRRRKGRSGQRDAGRKRRKVVFRRCGSGVGGLQVRRSSIDQESRQRVCSAWSSPRRTVRRAAGESAGRRPKTVSDQMNRSRRLGRHVRSAPAATLQLSLGDACDRTVDELLAKQKAWPHTRW